MIARALSAVVRSGLRIGGAADSVVNARRSGLNWRLDLRETIDFSIFLLGAFERRTISAYRRRIKSGDVVLDIGANIGAHTLQFARLVGPDGRVIAFEPTAFAFSKLMQNLDLNPQLRPRVLAEQIMLTDRDNSQAEPQIYSSWPLRKAAELHPGHRGQLKATVGCRVMTLDSYLAGSGLKRVDFVKLDVDGFECNVLQGGIKSFSAHKPTILMELSPYLLPERDRSIDDLTTLLRQAGFRLYRMNGRPLPMGSGLLRAVPPGTGINVLALAR